ncbi:LPS O-antigen chain length determinant protein WzzB [Pseudomonas sp. Z2-11]
MHQPTANQPLNDDIDVFALVRALWKKKWLILCVASLVTSAAAIYAFTSEPLYEAKLYTAPPTQNDIAELNYGRDSNTELPPYRVKDVAEIFSRNLSNESLRRAFFNDIFLPSLNDQERKGSQDRLYQRFSRQLTISARGKEDQYSFVITVRGSNPTEAADWVRTYVDNAGAATKKELISDVTREAQVNARNTEQMINRLRETARNQREDNIQVLSEALAIAQAVDLKKPVIISGKSPTEMPTGINGQALYMRGSDALEAEIHNLKIRVSDDPFISNLRPLQAKHNFLSTLNLEQTDISVYRQDGPVIVPDSPIKPNKSLIIALGMILGLMLGLLVAGGSYAMQQSRR